MSPTPGTPDGHVARAEPRRGAGTRLSPFGGEGSAASVVRGASVRVAVGATAVVAVAYLVIALGVLAIVTGTLTAQIDQRLADTLQRSASDPQRTPMAPPPGGFQPPERRPFGTIFIVWTVMPDGTVRSSDEAAVLPDELRTVVGPETVEIDGDQVRVRGEAVGDRYVIVGQSMASVTDAQSTIILAELVIGPLLLAVVFLGAVTIGRRVAEPIERARQRQLEFTADASHELRTPVSVIEAQTSLALAHDREAAWYRAAFVRIDRETRRMRRLLDDLLWLARFDSAAGPPAPEPVDLAIIAAGAADRFAGVAEARRLRLELAPIQGSPVIQGPAEWFDRLLGVLLDNACKYAPDGGIVRVTVSAEGDRVTLTVDDSGPGIPDDQRASIFDRFHRASSTGSGAGLGLAIADAIVRSTGGRWRIGASALGGASMAVSWARALPDRPASGASARAKRDQAVSSG